MSFLRRPIRSQSELLAAHARESYITSGQSLDRTFADYCRFFHYDLGRLAGKLVLDIGSGVTARMAREAADCGVTVVSVNPNWGLDKFRKESGFPKDGRSVAATAEQLPFRDGVFDVVLGLWSIPRYLKARREHYEASFNGVRRVMAPNGFSAFVPIIGTNTHLLRETLDSFGDPALYRLDTSQEVAALMIGKDCDSLDQPEAARMWAQLCDYELYKAEDSDIVYARDDMLYGHMAY